MSLAAAAGSSESEGDITRLADHLFRQEAGKLVSVLTSIFGIERLQMAEDVVQEALVRALRTWPYYGVPKNPAAWLTQTAKNLALDLIRREKCFHDKQEAIIGFIEQWGAGGEEEAPAFESEIQDNRLRLMFACCHPLLPREAQTALALKTLCGFSPAEIASAFLTSEAAIAKRLVRARQRIRELAIRFEIPAGDQLGPRLESVLRTLYFLYNEGYKASSGETLVKDDLCAEAIRLTSLLVEHPAGNQPRTHALLALMLLNSARHAGRVDAENNMLRLKDQDRSLWDWTMIRRGIVHLGRSAAGTECTPYHIQAAIAACHATAPAYESTDWPRILQLYDRWLEIENSPVVALNRAVAVANIDGPAAGLRAVESIPNKAPLEGYYLYHAVLGDMEARLENYPAAAEHFQVAARLTDHKAEKAFLHGRLNECGENAAPAR